MRTVVPVPPVCLYSPHTLRECVPHHPRIHHLSAGHCAPSGGSATRGPTRRFHSRESVLSWLDTGPVQYLPSSTARPVLRVPGPAQAHCHLLREQLGEPNLPPSIAVGQVS